MRMRKTYASRVYWEKYIDSIMDSINEDKETILNMLIYGCAEDAKITMRISLDDAPKYTFEITKFGEKSPFGEEDDE